MPAISTTAQKAKLGTGIVTNEATKIQIEAASIEILVGGPYTVEGEAHTYGHAALRVLVGAQEHLYDFGRYAGETGPFGEGRLRVWNSFAEYVKGEKITGRTTTGFWYRTSPEAAAKVINYFAGLTQGRPVVRARENFMKEYRLASDYHALYNNCATMTLAGARLAVKDIDYEVAKHNQGRGMSSTEKAGARLRGWPEYIFMPADLQAMLQANTKHPADNIEVLGGK